MPFTTTQPSEISSRIDDNSSLLPQPEPGMNNNFFGHFKGFSITPLKNEKVTQPQRTAPPVPVVPLNHSKVIIKPVLSVKPITRIPEQAPELPPLNPGSNPRPLISAPILENSTCTAKELMSPLKHVPKPVRPAPEVPRPLSTPNLVEDVKKGSALNRITSFLKSRDDKVGKVKINKDLKGLEISNPIPQKGIEIPVTELEEAGKKNIVMRAQSMRTGVSQRPQIHTFGSMRSGKRPTSIPCANRPTSPPPRPPPVAEPSNYDDCCSIKLKQIEESPTDNIYAVIEESPKDTPITKDYSTPITKDYSTPITKDYSPPKLISNPNSSSTESMGLLGEIVDEIQNRNFDSIYSTSTLARKKKEAIAEDDSTYANTSIYMNTAPSTTSSGYLHPSVVNTPKETPMSTFKTPDKPTPPYKPFASTLVRKPGPLASSYTKEPIKRQTTPPNLREPIKRQITPPNLREPIKRQITPPNLKKPTPQKVTPAVRVVPKSLPKGQGPQKVVNPDVVASTLKSPDVIRNSDKMVKPSVKPVVKKTLSVKPSVVPKTTKVATLQQKFENKPTGAAKRTTKS